MFALNLKITQMEKYITCEYCCYDILDDEGNLMEHECIKQHK
jgi:hypothetical protein